MLIPEKEFATAPDDALKYIDCLNEQYDVAVNAYNKNKAKADKFQKELGQAKAWESLLKGYWDALVETDRLVEDVLAGFSLTKKCASAVCDNAARAQIAFRWMIGDMINLVCCIEKLKNEVDNCVTLLESAPPADPLISGLKTLKSGLDAAFICALDALDTWLLVLKQNQILTKKVGAEGLYGMVGALEKSFKADESHIVYSSLLCYKCEAGDGKLLPPERPSLSFTPDECKDDDTGYPCKINNALKAIRVCLDGIREEYEAASKKKAEALICMQSLDTARKTAAETNKC